MLDGLRAIYGLVDCTDADFAFRRNVAVCATGISRAGRPDEENGARTCKIRGILFSQVSGSRNRHRLADVPLLALKCVDFRDETRSYVSVRAAISDGRPYRDSYCGPEVRLKEMLSYGVLFALRSPRTTFLASFRFALVLNWTRVLAEQ